MLTTLVYLVISLVVLALVIGVLVWVVRYMGWPDVVSKVFIVLGVLIGLLMVLDAFGVTGTGIYHRSDSRVIIHDGR